MSEQAFTNKKFSDEEKIDLLVLLAIILTTLENISENDVGLMMSLYKEIIKTMAELESMGHISQKGRAIEILNREALLNLENNLVIMFWNIIIYR